MPDFALLRFLLVAFGDWMNRHQHDVTGYLPAVNCARVRVLDFGPLRFVDAR